MDQFTSNITKMVHGPFYTHIVEYISAVEMLMIFIFCFVIMCNNLGRSHITAAIWPHVHCLIAVWMLSY